MRTLSLAALAILSAAPLSAQQRVDVLIQHGTLIDGTGAAAPRQTDVGIRADRIVFVGDATAARVTGARVIDATGLIVAPGFVDPHTHTEGDLSNAQRHA